MKRKVVIAVAVGLVFYSLSDVLLWARIFEGHLQQYDVAYQSGHRAVLVGLIAVGVVLLWDAGVWALWYALALYSLAWSGLADVLYYWLDGRAIPAALPWLDSNRLILPVFKPVTSTTLILSAVLWIIFWSLTLALSGSLSRVVGRTEGRIRDLACVGGAVDQVDLPATPTFPTVSPAPRTQLRG